MPTRKEKEELIIKLLQAGRTYKEISRECHASFSEISSINKKLQGDDSEPSIRNQAYKMFEEEKKKCGINEIEMALQVVEDIDKETIFLEFIKAGIVNTQEERDTLEKQKKELKNEVSSLTAEREFLERTKQLLLVEIASMIRHKVFIEQLFYSQSVNRRPVTRSE